MGYGSFFEDTRSGLAESVAILRYLGHKCNLIPENAFMAAKVDDS